LKINYRLIFSNDKLLKFYNKLTVHKTIPIIAFLLLIWQIIKGNLVFALILLTAFVVSIIFFAFAITLYEDRKKAQERCPLIPFPDKLPPDKIVICDMCEELIEDNLTCSRVSVEPSIILCPKCMLKYNDNKKSY